jgi:hypothetical protein
MDDDFNLVHSPLEERVTRDGVTIKVLIYRGEEDQMWVLEVVDEYGGSTVWDEPFASDQAAYDTAMATVAEEWIGSLARPSRQCCTEQPQGDPP